MTHFRLPAGTDVAEMALFDVSALPVSRPPDEGGLNDLAAGKRLIRLPTGSDGGYLLHLYVDEPLPTSITQYCVADDMLSGQFSTTSGQIAFGGVESAFQEFKPNRFIRCAATIAPGSYAFTAYHTDFPDELIEKAIDVACTSEERWLDRTPLIITILSIILTIALAASGNFLLAGLAAVCWYFALKAAKGRPAYMALAKRREEVQLDFPSIVVELRSDQLFERIAVRTLRESS